jgi:hypothetical protein
MMSHVLSWIAPPFFLFSVAVFAQTNIEASTLEDPHMEEICLKELSAFPKPVDEKALSAACKKARILDGCYSVEGRPIFHYDKTGSQKNPQRILALSLIHGDETPAGTVGRAWMARLENIDPRNSWRVIPIANPDGFKRHTRFNSRGVDLNRNFPTKDWEEEALKRWKLHKKSDPRRFPGGSGGSEPETQCYMKHLEEFKPDFIISVHTPLGVLDFDGPKLAHPPVFHPLPWLSLGNFPGSLGRYMWKDRNVPVLTIELKGQKDLKTLEEFDRLQDMSGTVAIQWDKLKSKMEK